MAGAIARRQQETPSHWPTHQSGIHSEARLAHPARSIGTSRRPARGSDGQQRSRHLNLGAGRVVMQDLVRISTAIADGSFYTNPALLGACRQVKKNGGTLHLLGLIGSGGGDAIDKHSFSMIDLAKRQGIERGGLPPIFRGRGTPPKSPL